jgi:hypothetical protein
MCIGEGQELVSSFYDNSYETKGSIITQNFFSNRRSE